MKLVDVTVTFAVLVAAVCSQRYELLQTINSIAQNAIGILPDDPTKSTELRVDFELLNILDYDYQKQTLKLTAWLHSKWNDSRFKWNSKKFGDITEVRIPCSNIPIPDLKLFNGAVDGFIEDKDINCLIYSEGSILRTPIVQFNIYCSARNGGAIDCRMKIGSCTHNCENLKLKSGDAITHSYVTGHRWQLKNLTQRLWQSLGVTYYPYYSGSYCTIDVHVVVADKPGVWSLG